MKISYLVTWSSETKSLNNLLDVLYSVLDTDELVSVRDSNIINPDGKGYITVITERENISKNISGSIGRVKVTEHALNNDYGTHKNWGIEQCSGDFIFQIDGDEIPSETLFGKNLHDIIEANPTIEAYAVPRINDFRGVTPEHAARWGWRLSTSKTYNRPMVNFPDWQFRIFLKSYPRISYKRRLHEKIEGYKTYVMLPAEEEYALYHDKTIEQQEQTNIRYNEKFTQDENKGHNPV